MIFKLIVAPIPRGFHLRSSSTNRPDTWSVRVPRAHIFDTVVVTLIFNRAAMEKTILLCPLIVTGEDEKINLQYQKT
jgi:hypothetical protein